MSRIQNFVLLLSLIPRSRWAYFQGWMELELQAFSDKHARWFRVLWEEWMRIHSQPVSESNPDLLSPLHPEALDFKALRLAFARRFGEELQERREENIRSDLTNLVFTFIGLERARRQPYLIETEAVFDIVRSPHTGLFSFYIKKLEKDLQRAEVHDAHYFERAFHAVLTHYEASVRHPHADFPPVSPGAFNTWSDHAWATDIAETSLSSLQQNSLTPLQHLAFGIMTQLAERLPTETDPGGELFSMVPRPGTARTIAFLYAWQQKGIPNTIQQLRHGIQLLQADAPQIKGDTLMNLIYLFRGLLQDFRKQADKLSDADRELMEQLRALLTEITLEHKTMTFLLQDFFILCGIYFSRADLCWQRLLKEATMEEVYGDIRQILDPFSTFIKQHYHKLPADIRPKAEKLFELALAFYLGDFEKVQKLYAEIRREGTEGIPAAMETTTEWHYLKMKAASLSPPALSEEETDSLTTKLSALSGRAKRQAEKKHKNLFLQQAQAADWLKKYLKAVKPATRAKLIRELEATPLFLDKYWLLAHLGMGKGG